MWTPLQAPLRTGLCQPRYCVRARPGDLSVLSITGEPPVGAGGVGACIAHLSSIPMPYRESSLDDQEILLERGLDSSSHMSAATKVFGVSISCFFGPSLWR
ncbi:Hypothetical predicted protein [Pelobates cultripes]|uniref:Uncharacterized protein n=1 Tax=Pelobates cultripes TaxID=61616 RepID=A0AAD1RTS6_PELCU|nr:Hypothetical predicted protein [Pelobates cultripes]